MNRAEQRAATAKKREARRQKAAAQAAAAEAARVARQRKERLVVGSVVTAVIALIVAVVWWNVRDTGPVAVPRNVVDDYALAVGDPDAPNEVTIHEDFLCPACASFEAESNELLSQAAAEGKVLVKYYPLNFLSRFGDYSKRSANALAVVLDAEGPEVAKAFHDSLFADQPAENGDKPDDDWLVQKAVAAGADEDAVRPGIEDRKFEDWVQEASEAASKRGVKVTPTITVKGQAWPRGAIADLMARLS